MKTNKQFLLFLILLSLLLLGNSQVEKDGIKLIDYPNHSVLKTILNLDSEKQLNQIIILPKTFFNEHEAAGIISNIDQLPTSLLQKVQDNGIVVRLFTDKLTDHSTTSHLKGQTPRGYVSDITWDELPGIGGGKTVLIKIGESKKGNGHGSVNLELHELAHSIDRHVFGELRNEDIFLKVWQMEKRQLFPDSIYMQSYPEEYFAEAFAYYYMDRHYRQYLEERAPLTYQLIKNLN